MVAGAVALAGLVVLHSDAHSLFEQLLDGSALGAVVVSLLAGAATLALVWRRRFEAARYSAALAVAAIIAGWALARYPTLLPGLSVRQAAASHDTLVTLIVAVLAGGALLFPALAWLFRLVLTGRFDTHAHDREGSERPERPESRPSTGSPAPPLGARLAAALLIAGAVLLNVADASWAHAVGIVSLFAFVIVAFPQVVLRALADQ